MKPQIKIAIIFFIGLLAIIILLSSSVYYFTNRYSHIDFYKRLEFRAQIAAKYHYGVDGEKKAVIKEIRELHLEELPEEKEYYYELPAYDKFIADNKIHGLPVEYLNSIQTTGSVMFTMGNTFFSGILYIHNGKKYVVIVSASNYYGSHHLQYLKNTLLIAIPLTSILAFLVAIFLSKSVFTPIRRIMDKMNEISSDNIHLRIETSNKKDDINALATTFNDLLDRLETVFETQNNFISNASHELGTPLTAIIGEADVTLKKKRNTEAYEQSLQIILNEAERLDKITKSLLFLAQTGFDGKKLSRELVRADQLIFDVRETIARRYPKNQIFIDLSLLPEDPYKLKIIGNQQLLHLAFSNIVSNACKYSFNKPVKIAIGASKSNLIIIVKDEGIGIPQGEQKYVYDAFFRASNAKQFEGYGIGLPLSRNIIRLHHGHISISSIENKGTTIEISFPLYTKVN